MSSTLLLITNIDSLRILLFVWKNSLKRTRAKIAFFLVKRFFCMLLAIEDRKATKHLYCTFAYTILQQGWRTFFFLRKGSRHGYFYAKSWMIKNVAKLRIAKLFQDIHKLLQTALFLWLRSKNALRTLLQYKWSDILQIFFEKGQDEIECFLDVPIDILLIQVPSNGPAMFHVWKFDNFQCISQDLFA